MKIVDLHGEPTKACIQFHYLGYVVSASSLFGKMVEIAIFDEDGTQLEEKPLTIPHAIDIINEECAAS